jgi:hypothetical protein
MKLAMSRDLSDPDAFVIRVTDYAFEKFLPQQFTEQMEKAIKEFIHTDPEVQILINQMVCEAFKSVDLLKVVTDAIKAKVEPQEGTNK